MPPSVRCFLNGFVPTLPIPDQHFDVITAFSVFTHIDELESSWLLELRRVLKPGGLSTSPSTMSTSGRISPLISCRTTLQRSDPTLEPESPFPGERAVYAFNDESYYSCNVFHSQEFSSTKSGAASSMCSSYARWTPGRNAWSY